ncbi:MAG: MFS transporter [Pseudomonadota bacterium]
MTETSQRSGLAAYFGNTVFTLLPANMFHYSMILLSGTFVGSPSFTGVVFFCIFLPIGVLTPLAGKALDTRNRRTLVFLGQAASLVALAGLLLLVSVPVADDLRAPIMIALALVMGASLAFVVPARLTFLADIADEKTLPGATALTAMLTVLGFGLAPVTVDFLKSQVGWPGLGAIIVVLHVLGMLMLLGARSRRVQHAGAKLSGTFRHYLSTKPVIFQALLAAALFFIAMGPLQVLLPRYFVESLGASELLRGAIISWLGGGLFVGAVAAQIWVSKTLHFGRGVILVGIGLGIATGLIAVVPNITLGGILLAVCGMGLGFGSTSVSVLLQQLSDDDHRGQTMAAFSMVFQLIPAVSGLLAGIAASVSSVPAALALVGVAIGTGLLILWMRARPFATHGALGG